MKLHQTVACSHSLLRPVPVFGYHGGSCRKIAAAFRRGRVFLAGDAVHVNNPIGGLGLNSGIHDAMELSETLFNVVHGVEHEAVLDRYERRRRQLNIEFVSSRRSPTSSGWKNGILPNARMRWMRFESHPKTRCNTRNS